jgi:hypothetical protein
LNINTIIDNLVTLKNLKLYFLNNYNKFNFYKFVSTKRRSFLRSFSTLQKLYLNEYNESLHVNPNITLDDLNLWTSEINNIVISVPVAYRINSLTDEKIKVGNYGNDLFDIEENIERRNVNQNKLIKLYSVHINIDSFPKGVKDYLNIKEGTLVQDLYVDIRFGLITYNIIISKMKDDIEFCIYLKSKFNFNDDFFSIDLLDFCLQRWDNFGHSKKKIYTSDLIHNNYNNLGKAIGLQFKSSTIKKTISSIVEYECNSFEEMNIFMTDFETLKAEIDQYFNGIYK